MTLWESIKAELSAAFKRTKEHKPRPLFTPSAGPKAISKAEFNTQVMATAMAMAAPGQPSAMHVNLATEQVKARLAAQKITIMGKATAATRVERMLLIASAAQLLAGPGKNPTKAQLAAAARGVDRKLAGVSVSGSWESGSFWKKVSNVAKQAGRAAVRAAPAAAKWAGKNPHILLPVATGVIASPFLIKAITSAAKTPQARQEAADTPPPPPQGEMTVATADEAPAEGESPPAEGEGAMSMGLWQGWDEVAMHGALTEEEVALAESGGAAEQEAILRTRGSSVMGGEISHDGYRASVMRRAQKLAGGDPATKHIFVAEKQVKQALRRNGIKISIPGARPSRRTA